MTRLSFFFFVCSAFILCYVVTGIRAYFLENEEKFRIVAELKEYFGDEIERLRETHETEMVRLQEYFKSEIAKSEERQKLETKAVEEKFMSEIRVLKEETKNDKARLEKELTNMKEEMETLKLRCTETVVNLTRQISSSRKEKTFLDKRKNRTERRATADIAETKDTGGITTEFRHAHYKKRQVKTSTRVAFFASLTQPTQHMGADQDIAFDNAVTNIGNAFHPNHGIFTAPVDGVYFFTATLTRCGERTYGHFVKNRQIISKINMVDPDGQQSSQTIIIELHKHDDVAVQSSIMDRDKKRQVETSTRVAFFASLTLESHHLGANQNIVFDNAVTNIGNAYHPNHGIFTAPVNGVYFFTVTLIRTGGLTYGHFMKNRQIIAKLWMVNVHESASQTVIIELSKGDDVAVQNTGTDRGFMGDRYSTFAGFLLFEYPTNVPFVGK